MELYQHQKEAVGKLHNGSILRGEVGNGKSKVAVAYYMKNEKPCDIYVITTAKKRESLDWDREFVRYGIGKKIDETVGGVLTVDSWNNITNYTEVYDAFFIFDEQRLIGSGAWSAAFIKIAKRNNWIMLTATPGDTWLDYIPVFVANGFYKNRTEFKREHVVYKPYTRFPKVERYVGVNKLVRYRNLITVEMPYQKHTVRNIKTVHVEYDPKLFERALKKRWHVYENRPLRNVAELFYVMRKVVNSDSSRLMAVTELMQKHPKLIVFYNFDYELEILRSLNRNSNCQTLSLDEIDTTLPIHINGMDQTQNQKEENKWQTKPQENSLLDSMNKNGNGPITSKSGKTLGGKPIQDIQFEEDEQKLSPHLISKNSLKTSMNQQNKNIKNDSENRNKNNTLSNDTINITSLSMDPKSELQKNKKLELENSMMNNSSDSEKSWEMDKCLIQTPVYTTSLALESQTNSNSLSNASAVIPILVNSNQESERTTNTTYTLDSGSTYQNVEVAEWNGHLHQEIPKTDRWVYLVQYVAGAEGWNCVETDAMCFYSLTYSYKIWHQAFGRIDRLNTLFTDLYYYVLMSNSPIDKAISKSLAGKKSFNEKKFSTKL